MFHLLHFIIIAGHCDIKISWAGEFNMIRTADLTEYLGPTLGPANRTIQAALIVYPLKVEVFSAYPIW